MSVIRAGLWRHPDFLRLWAGQTISQFGTFLGGLTFTAILWLDAGARELSLLAACGLVPAFVAGLVAGVWVDRLRRRPLLIATDLGRAFVLVTVPLAAFFGELTMTQLYLVALAVSGLTVTFDVSYEAYLPSLVEPEALVEGNSKLVASASVAEFAGFSLGGLLVQLFTAPVAVAIDATTFLWSALWIGRIRTPEPPPPPCTEREHLIREAWAGLRHVVRHRLLRPLAAANVLTEFTGQFYNVLILLYLNQQVGFAPAVLGVVFAVGGLTALLGAAFTSRLSTVDLGRWLILALLIRGAGALCIPLVGEVSLLGLALLIASQLITDPAHAFYEINQTSLRQAVTPEHLRGRMNATMRVLGFGAMLAGVIVAGLLGQTIGARTALFVAAGGPLLALLVLLRSPIARLDRMPAGEGDSPTQTFPTAAGGFHDALCHRLDRTEQEPTTVSRGEPRMDRPL